MVQERVISPQQLKDGYEELIEGVIYHRNYVVMHRLDASHIVVIDPESARTERGRGED